MSRDNFQIVTKGPALSVASMYSGLVGRTLRENDNDGQWKLLLPIMPRLQCTHQTILSDCLTVSNYLTIKNQKILLRPSSL